MASGASDWIGAAAGVDAEGNATSGITIARDTDKTIITKGRTSTGTIHTVTVDKTLFITEIIMSASCADITRNAYTKGTAIVTLELNGTEVFRLVAAAAAHQNVADATASAASGNQSISKTFIVPIRVIAGDTIDTTITLSTPFVGGGNIMIHGWEE